MLKNLINLTEPDLDIKIYRIFEYKWLKEMFEEKKMALVKPKEWDDPFENFILRSGGTNDKNESFTINFWDDFFGLCWTLTPESDAMWRIYSPKHEYSKIEDKVIAKREGVKVETTIRKLFTSFYSTGGEFASISN